MRDRLDLNTKLRITVHDAAFALSVSVHRIYDLIESRVIIARGNKILRSDIEKLMSRIYSPEFPDNINNKKERELLLNIFCKAEEIYQLKKKVS